MEQERYPLYLYNGTGTVSSVSISVNMNFILFIYIMEQELFPLYLGRPGNRNCILCILVDHGKGTVSSVSR